MVVYSLTDITEQKYLQQRNDRFMSMASHELKTPVTTIKTLVQLLELQYKNGDDKTLVEYLSTIGQQIDQLTKLVTDLLDVSKIKADKFSVEHKIFDFDPLLAETIKSCQLLSPEHPIRIHGKTNAQFFGDQNSISRVFINLITNAIKYSPDATDIAVRVSVASGHVQVAIEDHGVGIAKEHQHMIFERFYQVGNDSGQSLSGLGIGLHIASAVVAEHGGRIWVESEGEGKGSIFYFTLPIYQPESKT